MSLRSGSVRAQRSSPPPSIGYARVADMGSVRTPGVLNHALGDGEDS
jgi:hypothetical protein